MTDQKIDVDSYLRRIGVEGPIGHDLASMERLQRAHLTAVPFENLHVAAGLPVRTDAGWSVAKVVDQRRGGWCFENNGAFGALLEALGFGVIRLGAAVLLDGPNDVIDHLCLEVALDQPYLVDVGFGESFIRPLALNRRTPQDGGTGDYQFIDSTKGLTLTKLDDGVPAPQYRFKRVALGLDDFQAPSTRLASDPTLPWSTKPFATRLLDGGPDRVTLLKDRLKVTKDEATTETLVSAEDWDATLLRWFDMSPPG
ncbi:MAG: arylamine N-acetyltransferase family protein [Acidimicrobiales bacterium]